MLALAGGCGGGGGGGGGSGPVGPQDEGGIAGVASAPDLNLGRVAEREPNDLQAQAYRLPPVHARSRLEVAGHLSGSAAYAGVADVADVLRYTILADSDLSVTLGYVGVDPVGGGPNTLRLEALDALGGVLDEAEGPSPLSLSLAAVAGERVWLRVVLVAGHTPWVLSIVATDALAPAPKPSAAAAAPASSPAQAQLQAGDAAPCASEHVLVRLRPGVDAVAWAARHGHELGAATALGTCRVRLATREGRAASKPRDASRAMGEDPDVAWSEPDWMVQPLGTSNDPDLARQWGLDAIGALDAWDITRGIPQIVVAVIDTGVTGHPDLAGQTVEGYDFISDPGIAGDGDGRDADPTDVGDRGASSHLSTWHGTHVGAIVAGSGDDGAGVSGVAPGCRIMPLRVLGRGGGLVSDVADAVLFAAGQLTTESGRRLPAALKVVNLSLGTGAPSQELEDACAIAAAQGTLLVAASGNDGGSVSYPGAFPSVMAVGAVDGMLEGTGYSNAGAEVSLCAPGGVSVVDAQADGWPDAILSASKDETVVPAVLAHAYVTGTSQAAPHVAGVAALMLSVDPSLPLATLRQRLEQSALDRGVLGADNKHGHGLVQAPAALELVLARIGTPLATPPRLHLPVKTLRFLGLESLKRIPVRNSGGGVLTVASAQTITDDGGAWLGGTLLASPPGADATADELEVLVDRSALPPGPGWASGTLRLYGPDGGLGLVRVVVGLGVWPRAGAPIRLVAIDAETGGVKSDTLAHPQNDYRYVLAGMAAGSYLVKGGDDLDVDGFFCEPFDLCGWFGGPTQDDALEVVFASGRVQGTNLTLSVQGPP